MIRLKAGLLLGVGTIFLAAFAWAQAAPRGTVNGSVTKSSGPVVGVTVGITSAVSPAYASTATSDQNGAFAFSDAPVGGVTVTVYDQNGNVLGSAKGTLSSAGEVITVNVKLP